MSMSQSIMKIYCDYFREYRKTFVWVHTCCLLWMWEPVSGFYLFYFGEPTEINESLRMQSEYTGVTGEKSKLPEITLRH